MHTAWRHERLEDMRRACQCHVGYITVIGVPHEIATYIRVKRPRKSAIPHLNLFPTTEPRRQILGPHSRQPCLNVEALPNNTTSTASI